MSRNDLKYLIPAGGKHAIAEVVFEINLHPDTRLIDPKYFLEGLQDKLSSELPKADVTRAMFATLDTNGVSSQTPEDIGFTFEKYKADGSLEYRFHGQNQPSGQSSWIAVNLLSYSNWSEMATKAINWMKLVSDVQPGLKLQGVTLNFVDQFYWNDNSAFPTDIVFETDQSAYLPSRLREDLDGWTSQLSYAHSNEQYRQVENVNVSLETNIQNGHKRSTIAMPLQVQFFEIKSLDEMVASEQLLPLFGRLHDDNKRILGDILKAEISDMIALNDRGN